MRKRIIVVLLFILSFFVIDYNCFAFELEVKGSTGWATIEMPIRSSASSNSSVILNVNAGVPFLILDDVGEYWQIEYSGVIGYIDHDYCMINLPDVIPSISYNITNAYSSIYRSSGYDIPDVTGTKLYSVGKVMNNKLGREEYISPVLYSAAKKINSAQELALNDGYSLMIYDSYRPRGVTDSVGTKFLNLYNSNSVVKNNIDYSVGASGTKYSWNIDWFFAQTMSSHNIGSAIDVTLCDKNNRQEVVMPTDMHELSVAAIKYYSSSASKVPANYSVGMLNNQYAQKLDSYMTNAGMNTLSSEWWHFQDQSGYTLIKAATNKSGCYFQVDKIVSKSFYTLTYNDSSNVLSSLEYAVGDKITLRNDLKKDGYKLVGWSYNGIEYSLDNEFIMPRSDVNLVAIWEPVKYSLTYSDGNLQYTELYEPGMKISLKNDLKKDGYELVGWSYNGTEYDLDDEFIMPKANINLSAIFNFIDYDKNIFDDAFYKCIVDNYNSNNNTLISYNEPLTKNQLSSITELVCSSKSSNSEKISNINGVEYLVNLKKLGLYSNNINNVDLSKNVKLINLDLGQNNVKSIDLSKNINLEQINLDSNDLNSLDLSKNEKLKVVNLADNKIMEIDLSKNINLEILSLYSNELKSIDLSKNERLIGLDLSNNKINEINVSKNTLLEQLYLSYNNLESLDLSNNLLIDDLEINENYFIKSDIVYKNEKYYPIKTVDNVVFPGGSKSVFDSIIGSIFTGDTLNNSVMFYDDYLIFNSVGEYNKDGDDFGIWYNSSDEKFFFMEYPLVTVIEATSDVYVINEKEGYIVVNDDNDNDIINNIDINNEVETMIENDKLIIKYNDKVLKIFELKHEEIIPPLEIKKYDVDDIYINGISLNTDVDKIDLGIDSRYNVKIFNNDGTIKTSGFVGTGNKIRIYLDDVLLDEYISVVIGDITGDGNSKVNDVAKLYQYLKGKITMDEYYIKAGNVVSSDKIIKINDVAKLYQFIKRKINSL